MIEWWSSLSVIMKILWGITIVASMVFVIQSIMTFVGADTGDTGLDGGSDFDTDVPDADASASDLGHGGMNLYTFRNLVNFCLGFGWSSVLLRDQIRSTAVLLIVSAIVGIALVAVVMYMFALLAKMQESGNINVYKSAVGCQGKVYLTIPGERKGMGKVQVTINNAIREYDAMTEGDSLPNGTAIKIVEVLNQNTMLVEPLDSYII